MICDCEACDPTAPLRAEIDRLRAELDACQRALSASRELANGRYDRLAAVIELCDDDFLWPEGHRIQDTVRAAAQGQDSA